MSFRNRKDAGRQLASCLLKYQAESPIVLGLPRGGVVVAYEVAHRLDAPLDVWLVRKIAAPEWPEFGMGAVAEGDIVYLNRAAVAQVGASEREVREQVREKLADIASRQLRLRGGRPRLELEGRTVILVDDGIATGGTVQAAIQALRTLRPRKLVLATPVAASSVCDNLRRIVDECVCVRVVPKLRAIGDWYEDFAQVSDDEVSHLLAQARAEQEHQSGETKRAQTPPVAREVTISLGLAELSGELCVPSHARGLIIFAHGSGSGRFSRRNRHVALTLQRAGFATLLFDLLTSEEEALDEETAELRFDIGLLSRRLLRVTEWAQHEPEIAALPVGYFGASTGAAAALVAAAQPRAPVAVRAIVSRGGRPDLAHELLDRVHLPTLLVVGGQDSSVLSLNRAAAELLGGASRVVVIPGATHLFEEPGALEAVAEQAREWFERLVALPAQEQPAQV